MNYHTKEAGLPNPTKALKALKDLRGLFANKAFDATRKLDNVPVVGTRIKEFGSRRLMSALTNNNVNTQMRSVGKFISSHPTSATSIAGLGGLGLIGGGSMVRHGIGKKKGFRTGARKGYNFGVDRTSAQMAAASAAAEGTGLEGLINRLTGVFTGSKSNHQTQAIRQQLVKALKQQELQQALNDR